MTDSEIIELLQMQLKTQQQQNEFLQKTIESLNQNIQSQTETIETLTEIIADLEEKLNKNVSFFYLNSKTRSWPSKSG